LQRKVANLLWDEILKRAFCRYFLLTPYSYEQDYAARDQQREQ
jgi:hypothetical protein